MPRSDRLFQILSTLRDGTLHRAEDLARVHAVSVRTIYRDMDTLVASGVPVQGARGVGYRISDVIPLPPLTLCPQEVEALNLGIAIVAETTDPSLKSAALSLADKIDAALPARSVAQADMWKFATYPFADAVRGFAQMPSLRAAIRARQKLRLTYHSKSDRITTRIIRPLHMEYWGRVWTLTAWCENRQDFRAFRVDLIQSAEALPEMFVDEPGKRLSDHNPNL